MASIDALRRQVAALRAKVTLESDPKEWHFMMEAGQDIPEHIAQQIRPQDTVTIRLYPQGLMGDSEPTSGPFEPAIGYCTTKTGATTALYRSGKTQEMDNGRRRSTRR